MLLFNNEVINYNSPKEEIEKKVALGMKEIKAQKKLLILKDPSPTKRNEKGRRLANPPISFRLNTGQAVEWKPDESTSYFGQWLQTDKPFKLKDGEKIYEASPMIIKDEQTLSYERDFEKVFFFLYLYNPGTVGLIIQDKEGEAKTRNKQRELRARVEHFIFTEEKLTQDEKKRLAYAWGVNADGLSYEMLKEELYNKVELGEKEKDSTGRGYEQFLKEAEVMDKTVEVRSFIQQAIERNLIMADANKGWKYPNGIVICPIPMLKWARRQEVLVNYFLIDPDAYNTFKVSTMGEVSEEMVKTVTIDITGITDIDLLKNIAKDRFGKFFPSTTKIDTVKQFLSDKEILSEWLKQQNP